jgi:hypothetical protein
LLRMEKKREYYIYPSWAEGQLSYNWDDLPKIMKNPYEYDRFLREQYTIEQVWAKGYPKEIQPCDLISGPMKGGIIVAHISSDEKWLPICPFLSEANLCLPHPMEVGTLPQFQNAHYLDLRSLRDDETGEFHHRKNYTMGISAEHIESDPQSQYWFLSMRQGTKEPKPITDIPVWAYHFGIEMERIEHLPDCVRKEISGWLKPDFDYVWFKIRQKDDRYGWHFAVMMYIGLHLAYVARSRVRTMHLLASLEAKYGPYGIEMRTIF